MECSLLDSFRLAGGTGLSLQLGHRISEDIDLFTDQEYASIDFLEICAWLKDNFKYFDCLDPEGFGFGLFSFIGNSEKDSVKLDLLYPPEGFIRPVEYYDNIRFASISDIGAMKIDMITKPGRKKDFWDLSALLERYTIEKLIDFYKEMFPYSNSENIKPSLIDFSQADEDEDPRCLMNKAWELIRLDFQLIAHDS